MPSQEQECYDAITAADSTRFLHKVWSYDKMDRSQPSVSIADGLVYAADMPGRVHCLDAESGHCYWVHDCQSDIWSSTLVVAGKVFFMAEVCLLRRDFFRFFSAVISKPR